MKAPKITNVKSLKFHRLRDEISDELAAKGQKGLRLEEVWAIQRVLDRNEIELIQDIEKKSKASLLFRTTIILYFLFAVLLTFIYCPIKWIFSGKYYISSKSAIYRFMTSWERKLD